MFQQKKKPTATPTNNAAPTDVKKKIVAPKIDDVIDNVDDALDQSYNASTSGGGCGCWGR